MVTFVPRPSLSFGLEAALPACEDVKSAGVCLRKPGIPAPLFSSPHPSGTDAGRMHVLNTAARLGCARRSSDTATRIVREASLHMAARFRLAHR